MQLTYERLKEVLAYNPKTGKFYNRIARGRVPPGIEVGTVDPAGYLKINVDCKRYWAHRLAWFYTHGYFPENDIDHINRDPGDNRIANLREISHMCNSRNCGNRVNNSSGVKGTHWIKTYGKWEAYITVDSRKYNLGYYDDFDEAVCARLAAEQCLVWEGCDSSSPANAYFQEHINQMEKVAN